MKFKSGATDQTLGGKRFRLFGRIHPETGPNGLPKECMPQSRYANPKRLPLNPHGHGPFCRLVPPKLPTASGVYAVTVDRYLMYVGIANDLRQRWGPQGYASIQPRNCYTGGQPTNCKVNHRILLAAKGGCEIELWIHETRGPRYLEERLIGELDPPWNAQS